MEGLRKQRSDSGNNQRDNLLNSLHECDAYKELGNKIKDPEDIVEFDQIPIPFFKELLPLTDPFANQIIENDDFRLNKKEN